MLARLCAFRLRAPLWGGPNGASEFDGSVLAEVATLRARVEALQCGKLLSEFESKHKALRPLLDAAHCSLASHFVTVEVQRSYVLENEGFLLQTAARLKQLHALQEFINPKSVQGDQLTMWLATGQRRRRAPVPDEPPRHRQPQQQQK
eukprot:GHVT01005801.1.p1 GENE.GHVT01005801.1~~GHVT01005801.1.p1  ORF type:complete len:148 (+),score=31.38 GHVT01005801.1:372-815(+)